jgi:pilus assembly protein CpaD
MIFSSKAMLLLAPALLVSGCAGTVNRGVESVHQPVVERSDYAFDVATTDGGLAPGEAPRLAGWLGSLQVGYGDRIAIDDPNPGVGREAVREAVAVQAARYGLLVADDAPMTPGEIPPGAARVVVSRMKASVPGCPDWSRMAGSDFDANTGSNYGCATNASLAAMVARPEDLVRGQRGADTNDPATAYKAIDALRKAPTTGNGNAVKAESSKGGN